MADKQSIARIIALFSTAYPNAKFPQQTIQTYWMLLEDLPDEQLYAAALHCASVTCPEFPPSPAKLRQTVGDLGRQFNKIPSAYEAWQELLSVPSDEKVRRLIHEGEENIIEISSYHWSHPLVEKVAKSLGWPRRFLNDDDTVMADRAHFLKAYEAELNRATDQAIQIPPVRAYVESGGKQIKQLVEKLER